MKIKIPLFRLIAGILAALLVAFVFYSLLYLTREVFRILSLTPEYDLWILTDKEVNFYNLIFAFLAVIAAQSVFFKICFDTPRNIYENKHYRKTTIVNDQRALNWYFFSWFSKIAVIIFLVLGASGEFYVLNLYPAYNYIFILIVIVLFLQSWTTIRLVYKRESLKWMLFSVLFLSVSAFGLSRINLVNYNEINAICLRKNVCYQYNIDVPQSASYQYVSRLRETKKIYIAQKSGHEQILITDNKEVTFSQLLNELEVWLSNTAHGFIPPACHIFVDKNVKMNFIDSLERALANMWITKISYAVIPAEQEYDRRYYHGIAFTTRLNRIPREERGIHYEKLKQSKKNIIKIKDIENDEFIVNNLLCNKGNFQAIIKNLIVQNPNYVAAIEINENTNFNSYIFLISSIKTAVEELRIEFVHENYHMELFSLDYEEYLKVAEAYPFMFFTFLAGEVQN